LNCTLKAYLAINQFCEKHKIKVHIVTGPGYQEFEYLKELVQNDDHVILTKATGVISSIMEQCQIAITSNGRTVYELAHMNIPSIAIPQHDREGTHEFASEDTGFIVLKENKPASDEIKLDILESFALLVTNNSYRKDLFSKMQKFKFDENRKKVINIIMNQFKH